MSLRSHSPPPLNNMISETLKSFVLDLCQAQLMKEATSGAHYDMHKAADEFFNKKVLISFLLRFPPSFPFSNPHLVLLVILPTGPL